VQNFVKRVVLFNYTKNKNQEKQKSQKVLEKQTVLL